MSFIKIPYMSRLAVVLLMTGLAGCDVNRSSDADALVVDLIAVAGALGRDELMEQQMQQARQTLNQQLLQISGDLNNQLTEKKSELVEQDGDTEDTRNKIQELTLQANMQLNRSRQVASQKVSEFQAQLLREFRQEVMQVAQVIAEQRGAMYVYPGGSMLWHDASVDITDEVIGEMRAMKNTADTARDTAGDAAGDAAGEMQGAGEETEMPAQ